MLAQLYGEKIGIARARLGRVTAVTQQVASETQAIAAAFRLTASPPPAADAAEAASLPVVIETADRLISEMHCFVDQVGKGVQVQIKQLRAAKSQNEKEKARNEEEMNKELEQAAAKRRLRSNFNLLAGGGTLFFMTIFVIGIIYFDPGAPQALPRGLMEAVGHASPSASKAFTPFNVCCFGPLAAIFLIIFLWQLFTLAGQSATLMNLQNHDQKLQHHGRTFQANLLQTEQAAERLKACGTAVQELSDLPRQ